MAVGTQVGKGYVDIVPDLSGFQRSVQKEVEQATSKASRVAEKAIRGGAILSATVTPAVLAGLKGAADAASDLNESLNAVDKSYGDAAQGVMQLGEDAAQALGLSNSEFNSLAVRFSSFAETIAGDGGNVVGTLDDLTTRASDFASVMNLEVADAAEKFQSGLAGETEPLRQFGIDLSAAKVEAFAYANGIAETGEALTESEKVQARYGSLMEQTADFQGDFAETSEDAANAQRIAAAEYENAKAALGESLLPIMSDAAAIAGDVAQGFNELPDAAQKAVVFGGIAAAGIGPLTTAFGGGIKAVQGIKKAIDAMKAARAASTALDVAEGFGAIGAKAADAIPTVGGLTRKVGGAALKYGALAVAAGLAGKAIADATGVSQGDLSTVTAGFETFLELGESRQLDDAIGGFDGLAVSLGGIADPSLWENIQGGASDVLNVLSSPFGLDASWAQARQDIGAVDDALAEMVQSDKADQAAAVFDEIAEAAERQGVSVEQVADALPQYSDAVDVIASKKGELDDAADATQRNADAVSDLTGKTDGYIKSHRDLNPLLQSASDAAAGLADETDRMVPAQRDLNSLVERGAAAIGGLEGAAGGMVHLQRDWNPLLEKGAESIGGLVGEAGGMIHAHRDLNPLLEKSVDNIGGLVGEAGGMVQVHRDWNPLLEKSIDGMGGLVGEAGGMIAVQKDLNPLLEKGVDTLGGLESNAHLSRDALNDVRVEFRDLAGAAETVDDAIANLDERYRAMTGGVRNIRAATSAWEGTLDDLTASVEENGTSLDLTSEKGRANESAIRAAQDAAIDHGLAVLEQEGSIDKANETLDKHREDLYDVLIQAGLSEEAAEKYSSEIQRIPDDAETRAEFDDAAARERLGEWIIRIKGVPGQVETFAKLGVDEDELERWLGRLQDLNRTVTTRGEFRSSGGPTAFHSGGTVTRPGLEIVNDNAAGLQGELIDLPTGSKVTNSRDSLELLSAAFREAGIGGNKPTIIQNFNGGYNDRDAFRARQLVR